MLSYHKEKSDYMINSVEKALNILTELSNNENDPITVKKISEKLGINRSTCSHIVKTLEENGFAERISHHDGYVLGPEAYFLSRFGKYAENTIAICRPVLKWLYKKSRHPVILATIKNDKKFIIDTYDNENKIFKKPQNIRYDDIYRTATGRAILAGMNRDEVYSIFQKYGVPQKNMWEEVTSYETLLNELSKIGKKDVVMTVHAVEETDILSIGYGCAVYKKSVCVGAVGIALSMTKDKYAAFKEEEKHITTLLQKAVAEITRRMNYS